MAFINLGQVIYPVGAIYASASSTTPSNLFGGTWAQIKGDACLMAGTSVGNVGSKTIGISNIPGHTHQINWSWNTGNPTAGASSWSICLQGKTKEGTVADTSNALTNTGGGRTICLIPTDVICGGEQPNSSDAICVISKIYKLELVQALKQFVHSQLEQYTNLLTQLVQQTSMAEDGQLSQMEDSLDRRGLGMDLAERMNTNSQQMNCLAITTELLQGLVLLFLIVLLNMVAEELQLQHQILQLIEPEVQEIIGHTTIFPHIEPVIVGIELPSFIREVC